MDKIIKVLEESFRGIRDGKPSAQFIENICIDLDQSSVLLKSLATVKSSSARSFSINVWDKSLLSMVRKSIEKTDIGSQPHVSDSGDIIVNIPSMTTDMREKLVRIASQFAEDTRIALRQKRKSMLDQVKKDFKNSLLSEDNFFAEQNRIQKEVDKYMLKVDTLFKEKKDKLLLK